MGDLIALSIVLMVVLWSVHVVLRRLMPKISMKWQQRLADRLSRWGLHKLSRWLQPVAPQGGCGGCHSCGDSTSGQQCASTSDGSQPVQWRS